MSALIVSPDFEPRPDQYSASQLSLASDCAFAWGQRYLLGLRRPEPVWGDPNLDPRDKTLAFGKALHARLESFFNGENVDWTDEIGRRALPGLAYLPSEPPVWTEQGLGEFLESSLDPELSEWSGLSSDLVLHLERPLRFVGYKDLITASLCYDYKTTGQVGGRWQKTAVDLRDDPAANLYAYDDMRKLGTAQRAMRWVYFQSRDACRAMPVDFMIERDHAERNVRALVIEAATLRQNYTARPHELPKNLNSCKKYGGCPYHYSA